MDLVGMQESEVRELLAVGKLNIREKSAARNFLDRRRRFAHMDTEGEQVFPGSPIPDEEQTHNFGEYHDGA